jgi:Thiolase, C-terminal domain
MCASRAQPPHRPLRRRLCSHTPPPLQLHASVVAPANSTPTPQVNPNGGAIALGHPLGCTGARQVATLLQELRRGGGGGGRRRGVVSMCIGTGMGAAAVFESEPAVERVRSAL